MGLGIKNTEGNVGCLKLQFSWWEGFPESLGYTDNRDKLTYTLIYTHIFLIPEFYRCCLDGSLPLKCHTEKINVRTTIHPSVAANGKVNHHLYCLPLARKICSTLAWWATLMPPLREARAATCEMILLVFHKIYAPSQWWAWPFIYSEPFF